MICFCHQALLPLQAALPSLNVSVTVALPHENLARALADFLAARALPAPAWTPDAAWLGLQLPRMTLSASAMATISALAQLRAQVQARFGLDLLLPEQAALFRGIVATMQARVAAMATVTVNPLAWQRLAAVCSAADRLTLALKLGAPFQVPAEPPMPGGVPLSAWRQFLAALVALAPMIAAAAQLNVNLSEHFTAALAASVRPLNGLILPPPANAGLMANLTAALTAVAQLRASLGIDPLRIGLPAVREMVSLRLAATMQQLPSQFPFNPLRLAEAELLSLLPQIPYCPTSLATEAVVSAAASINAQALASLNWQVPEAMSLSAVRVGLPAASFAASLHAALGIDAAVQAPCGSGCDAASILAA
jgi:hypothetical protein